MLSPTLPAAASGDAATRSSSREPLEERACTKYGDANVCCVTPDEHGDWFCTYSSPTLKGVCTSSDGHLACGWTRLDPE